ncbi:hypothetical protein BDZ85DRAFT_107748 [Elsinoe ampelina]|uniref:Nicotinamide-nucleotide adenylyltransferase n=1 Tax=Elsinoe ampelina TaxID=302913 RepID=A0A6A6GCD5_9PEZI|nr:hypothetical protein BDZ85DRAFT_107748 [Elsinoe ampelina]
MSVSQISFRTLLPELFAALKAFQSSSAKFGIVHSVSAPLSKNSKPSSPKTLLILDSSFNPPSRAHLTLAKSALHKDILRHYEPPYRFLLLFSTQNADKAPSAASFDQRLALMTVFAQDLIKDLQQSDQHDPPDVDIGLTTAPYYTDKSTAISTEGKDAYPDSPRHIHIMGFDTITRFLAPKYYKDFDPPLSALNPYFDAGHELRVTLRPSNEYGFVEDQKAFISKLGRGELEAEGGKPRWAKQIATVEASDGVGVSSTRVRKAAKAQRWDEVSELCTQGIADAVRENSIYEGDDRGAKMA